MARLVFVVEVDSNEEDELKYLEKLRDTFVAITDLQAWGFTQDELICRSNFSDSSTPPEQDVILGKEYFSRH